MRQLEDTLKEKLLEMYPEIANHDVQLGLHFYRVKNLCIVTLQKESRILTTFLRQYDIDKCMDLHRPDNFGIQIEHFLRTVVAHEEEAHEYSL
jgi:predicted transport protein